MLRLLAHKRLLHARALSSAAGLQLKNVRIDVHNGIAVVRIDQKDSKVNTLSKEMNEDLEAAMNAVESDSSVRAAVLVSSKKGNFIAGADINMLAACTSAAELQSLSSKGQNMFNRLVAGKPKVAAIDGSCLGGGLEVALACHYRIASPDSSLALPEVMLGLLPGAGGTQRLPKLIGLLESLPLVLTGKTLNGSKAKKLGLVDSVADPFALEHAAMLAAQGLADGTLKVNREPQGMKKWMRLAMEGNALGRNYVFNKAREGVMKQTGGAYPAPLKILDVIKTGLESGPAAGYAAESAGFGELGMTRESKALVSIFHGQTACKKNPFTLKGETVPKAQTIGILGAGLMGAGIAQVSIQKGYSVVLKDKTVEGLGRGESQVAGNLASMVKKKKMTAPDCERMMSRLIGQSDSDPNWQKHFAKSDVVIEAVFEDLALKHKIIQAIEPLMKPSAIFATNTSALPIAEIAKASKRPERVVGMHYFSPVDKMPLLEIIPHAGTCNEASAIATEVGLKQGKTVIVVKDVPGFYVNRALGPFMAEVSALLADGADIEGLDKALTKFGMPVGPITLADEVGIDVASHVQEFLSKHLGERMQGGPENGALKGMLAAGMLGRKAGKGFYVYGSGKGKDSKKKTPNPDALAMIAAMRRGSGPPPSVIDMQQRMILRFVNEAALCLQDSIIADATSGDIGAVFGIGFPPFLGGPFRYVDSEGAQAIVDRMKRYRDALGPQFSPAQILEDLAKKNGKFHK